MKRERRIAGGLLAAAVAVAILALFFVGIQRLDAGRREEGGAQLESALRRAAAACYAVEGFYPPNTEYIARYYGVQIDESRYVVFYEVFAENLMPEITVLVKEK